MLAPFSLFERDAMSTSSPTQPPGWYNAQGDPPGTQRYWDGAQWQGGPQAVPTAETFGSPGIAGGLQLALWRRLVARLIDFFILLVPTVVVSLVFLGGAVGFSALAGGAAEDVSVGLQILVTLGTGFIGFVYEYLFHKNRGATPGKMAMSIKVVNEDGSRLTNEAALKRMIIRAITLVPIIGGLFWLLATFITCVLVLVDQRNQGLSDKIAKTLVVMDN